jgi:hypothetical protein
MKTPFVVRALLLSLLATVLLVLPACSTPQTRAQENPAIMQSLSPADRELVLNHRIRIGMSKAGVFIAYGRPDRLVRGMTKEGQMEAWIYTSTEYVYAGGFAAFPAPVFAPGYAWARGPRGYGFRGGYWGGGYWGGGFWNPYVGVQVPHRRVMFVGDRVVAFEERSY